MKEPDSVSENSSCPSLSIIIPVMNEEESLSELLGQIVSVLQASLISAEVIFIDDGSTDSSWKIIESLSYRHMNVSGIRFRRNFGKAAALTAGMRQAAGEFILMMDADLQDDPAEIPSMLAKLHSGADVVNGWKQNRLDPWHKVYPSRVFNWMVSSLTGLHLHDHNCGLKMFRKEVAQEIRIYGELHRFIAVLAWARGFRVEEMIVHHRPRQFGHSKYGVRRFLRGLLDLMTVAFLVSFGRRPQHALGAVGLFFFGLGIVGLGYLGLLWFLMNVLHIIAAVPIGGRPLLAYSIAFVLLGGQALSLGLLAELIVAYTGDPVDSFSVKSTTKQTQPSSNGLETSADGNTSE
ncbi:MAG: glycosyltransferase family 2 protein [Planctomycetaceae bacterium]|nr:glycosyltransferase family 2 protein [Planctomycetaceae bacterium]